MKWWRGIFSLQWCCMKSEKWLQNSVNQIESLVLCFYSMTPLNENCIFSKWQGSLIYFFLITLDPKHIFFLNTNITSLSFFWIPTLFIMRSCARCRTSGITARSSNPKEQNSFTSLRLNDHSLSNVPFSWTIGTNSVVPYLVFNITIATVMIYNEFYL